MSRPQRCRRVCEEPKYTFFSPDGQTTEHQINLTIDEFEVIRLVDYHKMTHRQCAEQMEISRTTVTEIYESARYKIADAFIHGKTLQITGGNYHICSGSETALCGKHCPLAKLSDKNNKETQKEIQNENCGNL